MSRFLKILAGLIVLLIIVAVAVPFVVPADKIKAEVLAQIETRTGRTVTIDRASFSIFPTLGLDAEGVKIGNPAWAGTGDMADIRKLKVGIALLPILHGQYRLKELTLVQPVITLIRQQGRANWEFGKTAPVRPAAQAPGRPTAPAGNPSAMLADLHLDKIAISDGTVTYKDGNKIQTIPGINFTLRAPDFDAKADIALAALYGSKKLDAKLTLDTPGALATGKAAGVTLKASYGALDFTWEGTVAVPQNGVPSITGKMDIPSLDMAQLSQSKDESRTASAAQPRPAQGASRWSDAPIGFDALKSANADLTMSIGKLVLPKTTLENIAVKLKLAGGALQIQAQPIKAYGGTINLSALANNAGAINLVFAAEQAEAEPLLHDFAGFDRISGVVNMQTKLSAVGNSQRALVNSLSGSGSVAFKNGKLKGVNLAGLVRNLTGAGGEDQSTDFSELSASYTIAKGIVTTNDIKLASPLLRVSGAGTVDLPNWQDHLLIKPMLVASLQGQGGKDASGITVPVRVEGPVDHPSYRPDLQSALQENLKNPAQLKQNAKDLKKTLLNGGGLQNLLR